MACRRSLAEVERRAAVRAPYRPVIPQLVRKRSHRVIPQFPASKSENPVIKKVAVLGGGPAGAFAAERLARAGLETVVLDEKLAWEKPCGGGITYKAYSRYPFFLENDTPKKIVTETCLAAHPKPAQSEWTSPVRC